MICSTLFVFVVAFTSGTLPLCHTHSHSLSNERVQLSPPHIITNHTPSSTKKVRETISVLYTNAIGLFR